MRKKILILSLIVLSFNKAYSSVKLSSDEYLNGLFTSSATKSIMQDSFDYYNDLAVVSDRIKNEEEAKLDAIKGLKNSMIQYVEPILFELLEKSNLTGPSFDIKTMKKMAVEISDMIITNNIYSVAKVVKTDRNEYLVLVKISKDILKKEIKKEFKNRLKNVILRLNDYYHEIGE